MAQKDVKLVRTPPCFSLGMDDWLVDLEYEDDQETVLSHEGPFT